MKVSIIGASGKVGTELTRILAEHSSFTSKVDVVLYAPNNSKKIVGQLVDLEESVLLRGDVFAKNINFVATSDIADIKGSELVVICSGLFATKEEKVVFKTVDMGACIQNIMLKATEMKIGTCWIGIAPNIERMTSAQKILNIDEEVFAILSIGKPKTDEVFSFTNRFDESRIKVIE